MSSEGRDYVKNVTEDEECADRAGNEILLRHNASEVDDDVAVVVLIHIPAPTSGQSVVVVVVGDNQEEGSNFSSVYRW